jgi:hypothetical protein
MAKILRLRPSKTGKIIKHIDGEAVEFIEIDALTSRDQGNHFGSLASSIGKVLDERGPPSGNVFQLRQPET